jgi:hypothetical protein
MNHSSALRTKIQITRNQINYKQEIKILNQQLEYFNLKFIWDLFLVIWNFI